jgi:hypothetical protein
LTTLRTRLNPNIYRGVGLVDLDLSAAAPASWDFSNTNRPTTYTSVSDWESRIPSGTTRVDIQTGSSDFYTNLANTVNAASGPVLVNLGVGDYVLDQFRMIGSSGDPSYAFGFWFQSKFRGFTGQGYDKTFVSMAANSMTQAQLDRLAGMKQASFAPNQMGMFRLDSSASQPFFMGGLTFRAANQNMLTQKGSDLPSAIVIPQPAPHQGPTFYNGSAGVMSHVRFEGAGKAWMSQPPFEMANMTSARSRISYYNCDFDGRLSAAYDPARPRKCGVWMGNDEYESRFYDSWLHHSNVSRYAANDEGQSDSGRTYTLTRTKVEQITNTQNDGNGGYTNATPLGWESSNAEVVLTDMIVSQDNPYVNGQIPQTLQFTHVGAASADTSGGRLRVNGGTFRNIRAQLDGWLCIRATTSQWINDGQGTPALDVLNKTMFVYPNTDGTGTRKQPWIYADAWPPTAAQMTAAGVSKDTHYLVRRS